MAVDLPVPVAADQFEVFGFIAWVDSLPGEGQAVLSLSSRAFGLGSEQRTALVSCSGHSIACK